MVYFSPSNEHRERNFPSKSRKYRHAQCRCGSTPERTFQFIISTYCDDDIWIVWIVGNILSYGIGIIDSKEFAWSRLSVTQVHKYIWVRLSSEIHHPSIPKNQAITGAKDRTYHPDESVNDSVISIGEGEFSRVTSSTSIALSWSSKSIPSRARSYARFPPIWRALNFGGIWEVWLRINSLSSSRVLVLYPEVSTCRRDVHRSNESVVPSIFTVNRYLFFAFSSSWMSLVLFSVAMRISQLAKGSRVPVCPIFFVLRIFRSRRMTSKLLIVRGLSMR